MERNQKFEGALRALKYGYDICRATWNLKQKIVNVEGSFILEGPHFNDLYIPTQEDLKANDWIIIY